MPPEVGTEFMTMLCTCPTTPYAEMGQSGYEFSTPVDLRDMLLHKLISGKLRVKAGHMIEIV